VTVAGALLAPDAVIVVDASAVVEWLLGGSRCAAVARALEHKQVLVPAHLDVEVAQVTRRLGLNAVTTPSRGRAMVDLLAEAPFTRIPLTPLLPRIWALRDNLTAYDAAYVALAEALESPLLTFDVKIPAASGHRARILVPE
jgi:predicted nucleic acid-binding protein